MLLLDMLLMRPPNGAHCHFFLSLRERIRVRGNSHKTPLILSFSRKEKGLNRCCGTLFTVLLSNNHVTGSSSKAASIVVAVENY